MQMCLQIVWTFSNRLFPRSSGCHGVASALLLHPNPIVSIGNKRIDSTLQLTRCREVCLHLCQVGTKPQRFLIDNNRLVKLPQFLISQPKVIECFHVIRLNFKSGSVRVHCLHRLFRAVGSEPQFDECLHIARQEF